MLKIGVQTKGIVTKDIIAKEDMWRGFRRIHDAGFERVDFNLDAFLMNNDVYAGRLNPFFDKELSEIVNIFAEYKQAMEAYHIQPSQMHAPYPIRVVARPDVTKYMQTNVIPKSIVVAEALGVPWVVMHPFKLQYTHGKEQERKENLEYFRLFIPLLRQCGVKICFENLYESVGGRLVEGVCADPEEAVWYVDTLNAEAGEELFGMCLDTGHLQLVKRDHYEYITRLGSRIKLLHIHENDGIGDLHEMPFTFGSEERPGLNWDGIIRGLRDIKFDGTLSFETFPCMNAFPHTVGNEVLSVIHEIGCWLAKQIEGDKTNVSDKNICA